MKNEEKLFKDVEKLRKDGYKVALAIATEAEVKAGAACGQLSIITQNA